MNCGVYKIESPSGNFYIGSTSNFAERRRAHFRALRKGKHHSAPLQRAWNKYAGALVFRPIIICSKSDRVMYEQLVFDGLQPKYNATKNAAAPMLGVKHGPDARKKIGDASKRLWASDPSYREKMRQVRSALNKSQVFSNERREKMSLTLKAYFAAHPEALVKLSIEGRAYKHTAEAKKKIKDASIAAWANAPKERREKFRDDTVQRNKEKDWSPEVRAAMSKTKSERYAKDPDLRARIAASVKGFKHTTEAKAKIGAASRNLSPETLAKRSASLKAAWALRKEFLKQATDADKLAARAAKVSVASYVMRRIKEARR
jgi:group I intron endonuclease